MPKASEMIDKQNPTVKEMMKEDPMRGKMMELRTEHKAAMSNAEVTGDPKPPAFEEWVRDKGYKIANGQLVSAQ